MMQTNLIGVEVITCLLKSEFTFETGDNDSDDFVKGIVIEKSGESYIIMDTDGYLYQVDIEDIERVLSFNNQRISDTGKPYVYGENYLKKKSL